MKDETEENIAKEWAYKKVSDLEQSHSHFIPTYIILIDAYLDVSWLWALRGKTIWFSQGPNPQTSLACSGLTKYSLLSLSFLYSQSLPSAVDSGCHSIPRVLCNAEYTE